MEWLALSLFCGVLLLCIIFNFSILYALAAGLVIFLAYGRKKGHSWRELGKMVLEGVLTVKNILITFALIGILTALWRASGTIPVIVCYAAKLIKPSIFILMTFLLNCGVSILTGTSFGTSATMGVICATVAAPLNVDIRLVGGAVLAGAFFGDRCSPVSTSALLVAEMTKTTYFDNIKNMLRSAIIPFLIACAIHLLLGMSYSGSGEVTNLQSLMDQEFNLHWLALIPAVIIFALAMMRISVKIAMTASIISAIPICIFLQDVAIADIFRAAIMGFKASDPSLSAMIDGGGLVSMIKVVGIICLSSSYSGIFRHTGLLDGTRNAIEKLADKTTPYCAVLCTSIMTSMVGCNQTLAIMLAAQLCGGLKLSNTQLAHDLEDSAVVVAPLIPWSLACVVPLTTIGAPISSMVFAFYLYLLPLWRLILSFVQKKKAAKV